MMVMAGCPETDETETVTHHTALSILKELHWLPIEQRVTSKVLLLAYMKVYMTLQKYLSNLLVRYILCQVLYSSDKYPKSKCTY